MTMFWLLTSTDISIVSRKTDNLEVSCFYLLLLKVCAAML